MTQFHTKHNNGHTEHCGAWQKMIELIPPTKIFLVQWNNNYNNNCIQSLKRSWIKVLYCERCLKREAVLSAFMEQRGTKIGRQKEGREDTKIYVLSRRTNWTLSWHLLAILNNCFVQLITNPIFETGMPKKIKYFNMKRATVVCVLRWMPQNTLDDKSTFLR